MLTSEVKKTWVDALRSGDYIQGRGRLQFQGRFCCLGVLLHAVSHLTPAKDKNSVNSFTDISEGDAYAELDCVIPPSERIKLANMNDNGMLSFDEIADHIELNL